MPGNFITFTFEDPHAVEEAIAKELKKRFTSVAKIDLDTTGLSDSEIKFQKTAIEMGLKAATKEEDIKRYALQWQDSGYPVAEEGGSIAQLAAEEAERQAGRYVLMKMRSARQTEKSKKILDGIIVHNATTEGGAI